eukprot:NODE_4553_length_1047_cov_152.304113_g4350_i0.p1 GENE.NODE_4553_length_1047_cov_152.304113_g4350_i0~~NODE_4553_length_1047_cov_152.304113_g4350_i0.p1  ORF type:complete len:262 (-),score=93.29 NODE_4553_length_1047_cov_152.304113_g4350_i0:204-989(-)
MASPVERVLGSAGRTHVIAADGTKTELSELASKEVVGIYFSAHWCPPCRAFTPKLAKAYQKLQEAGKSIEIVFCSWDQSQDQFDEYFKTMPWKAIPYEDRDKKDELEKQFQVDGIPTLTLLDKDGGVIAMDGTDRVLKDPKFFPFTDEMMEGVGPDDEDDEDDEDEGELTDDQKNQLAKVAAGFKAIREMALTMGLDDDDVNKAYAMSASGGGGPPGGVDMAEMMGGMGNMMGGMMGAMGGMGGMPGGPGGPGGEQQCQHQ